MTLMNSKMLYSDFSMPNKSVETTQKPAGGFLIAHFKRYIGEIMKIIIVKQLSFFLICSILLSACNSETSKEQDNYSVDIAPTVYVPDQGVAFSKFPSKSNLVKTIKVLDYLDIGGIEWNATSSSKWLTVTSSGLSGEYLTLTANPSSLAKDTLHKTNVYIVSSYEGVESIEEITVTLWISASDLPETREYLANYTHATADPVRPYVYLSDGTDTIDVFNLYTGGLIDSFTIDTDAELTSTIGEHAISNNGKYLFLSDTANNKIVRIALDNYSDIMIFDDWARLIKFIRVDGYPVLVTNEGHAIDAITGKKFNTTTPILDHADYAISASLFGNRYCVMNSYISPYSIDCLNISYSKTDHDISTISLGGISHDTAGYNGKDIALNADGSIAYIAQGNPYEFTKVSIDDTGVNIIGSLLADAYPGSVEIGPDDQLFGSTSSYFGPHDIWVYDKNDSLIKMGYVSGEDTVVLDRALTVSGDGSVAVLLTDDPKLVFYRSY